MKLFQNYLDLDVWEMKFKYDIKQDRFKSF